MIKEKLTNEIIELLDNLIIEADDMMEINPFEIFSAFTDILGQSLFALADLSDDGIEKVRKEARSIMLTVKSNDNLTPLEIICMTALLLGIQIDAMAATTTARRAMLDDVEDNSF